MAVPRGPRVQVGRPRRSRLVLLAVAAAAVLALAGTQQLFATPGRLPKGLRSAANGAGAAAASSEAAATGPTEQPPRRSALGLLAGAAAGTLAAVVAVSAGVRPARAFELESNRQATYNGKAKQLNDAVDWYLFDIRPLIYPPIELVERSDCEAMGDNCPEMAGLGIVSQLYQTMGQTRGGGGVVLSKLERDVYTPMKTLATSSVFDPDTSDDLADVSIKFEKSQVLLGRAATRGDLKTVRAKFTEGRSLFNDYIQKVNAATGMSRDMEFYLAPIPVDGTVLEEDEYWARRARKFSVKKKVDAVSKGNKTARFYAKSMFGDDAVSWDPRGDRAPEFWK